jgi:hypothetical protein
LNTSDYIRRKYNVNGKEPFAKIEGMTRVGMYELFAELGFKNGCEVGVWQGKNAVNILESIPGVKLLLVDPYSNHPYVRKPRTDWRVEKARAQAHNRLDGKNVVFIEELSESAVMQVPDNSLDFAYIDGEHTYDQFMLDTILWSRKVRSGGILSGHDYFRDDRHLMEVVYVVNDYTKVHRIPFYITDRKAEEEGKRNQIASWFWVKP